MLPPPGGQEVLILLLGLLVVAAGQPVDGVNLEGPVNDALTRQGRDTTTSSGSDVTGTTEDSTLIMTTESTAFWGIDEEPYRTVLFYVLISCSVLLLSTLVLLTVSMIYAKIRGSQSQAQASVTSANIPSKGSMRDRLTQKPGKKSKPSNV